MLLDSFVEEQELSKRVGRCVHNETVVSSVAPSIGDANASLIAKRFLGNIPLSRQWTSEDEEEDSSICLTKALML